jgi:hypothetical protein
MRRHTVHFFLRFRLALVRLFRSRERVAGALARGVIVLAALAAALQTSVLLVRKSRSKYPPPAATPQPGAASANWSFRSILSLLPKSAEEGLLSSTTHAGLLPSFGARREHTTVVPEAYPALTVWEQQFIELVRDFPHLTKLYNIGTSAVRQHPIIALRLSDRPDQDEDEPAVLFTALHHAREPAGIFICKALIRELLANYEASARHRRLVDSLDIWIVPVVNPDGYQYIMESQRQFPWWRKNLRDNDNDGHFDTLIDGVDLNRNYDYNWDEGGEGESGSWFYRGQSAFSETEIQSLRNLELQRNFLIGVSFHSYGEAVLYPWGNFHRAPDQDLILDIARSYASCIGRLSGQGTYNVLPLNGRVGQSSVWMYGAGGVIDFICETGEEYFPPANDLFNVTQQNVNGAMFLLERALRSGISGHVVDAETGAPLEAEILISGYERDYVRPRRSHPLNGRFDRLLLPGTYDVYVQKKGFHTAHFEKIAVRAETSTPLEVALHREMAEEVMSNE